LVYSTKNTFVDTEHSKRANTDQQGPAHVGVQQQKDTNDKQSHAPAHVGVQHVREEAVDGLKAAVECV
jgi:hypothetical protein